LKKRALEVNISERNLQVTWQTRGTKGRLSPVRSGSDQLDWDVATTLLTPESHHGCHHLEASTYESHGHPEKVTISTLPLRHHACFSPPHQSWYSKACLSNRSKPRTGTGTSADSAPGKPSTSATALAWRSGTRVARPHLYLPSLSKLTLNLGALAPLRKRYAVLLGLWKGKDASSNY